MKRDCTEKRIMRGSGETLPCYWSNNGEKTRNWNALISIPLNVNPFHNSTTQNAPRVVRQTIKNEEEKEFSIERRKKNQFIRTRA